MATLLLAGVLLGGCGASAPARPAAGSGAGSAGTTVLPAAERRPVPDISGRTLDGAALALRDLTGSVVVINVWASWCTSCRAEAAAIAAVARQLPASSVRFVGIDEQDSPESARHFLLTTRTTYPQMADPNGDLLHELALLPQTGIPSTLFLDPQGRMAARVVGPVTEAELGRLIRSLREVA